MLTPIIVLNLTAVKTLSKNVPSNQDPGHNPLLSQTRGTPQLEVERTDLQTATPKNEPVGCLF
ncbi:hypothetical protein D3C87_1959600 [compost metagenome]